jgi:hypothetical protein
MGYNAFSWKDTIGHTMRFTDVNVWVPKYRYQVLVRDVKARLKEIIGGCISGREDIL